VCCVRVPGDAGRSKRAQEVQAYSTMTRSLLVMVDRLGGSGGVTGVVMEATSDYWEPPLYLLEATGFVVWLVSARDVKHLPGPAEDRPAGRGVAVQGRGMADAAAQSRATADDSGAA
jgi:transposase